MATPEIEARARELTDEQLRWVQDDVALDGCPLCGAEACLEACEELADKIDAYVRELAAACTTAEIKALRVCNRAPSITLCGAVLARRGLVDDGIAAQHGIYRKTRNLGRAVLRVLEDDDGDT